MPGNEVRSGCDTAAKEVRRTCALCRHFAPWRARVRANIERMGFDGAYRLGMPDGVCLAGADCPRPVFSLSDCDFWRKNGR